MNNSSHIDPLQIHSATVAHILEKNTQLQEQVGKLQEIIFSENSAEDSYRKEKNKELHQKQEMYEKQKVKTIELEKKISQLYLQIRGYQAKSPNLESQNKPYAESQLQVAQLQKKISEISQDLELAKKDSEKVKSETIKLEEKLNQSYFQIKEYQARLINLESENKSVIQLQKKISTLNQKLKLAEEESKEKAKAATIEFDQKYKQLLELNSQLQTQTHAEKQIIAAIQEENQTLKNQQSHTLNEAHILQTQQSTLLKRNELLEAQNQELKNKVHYSELQILLNQNNSLLLDQKNKISSQQLEMAKEAISRLTEYIQRLNHEKREIHQTHHEQLQKIEASKLDLEAKYQASSNQNTQITQNLFQKEVQIRELRLSVQQSVRENQNLRTQAQNLESQVRTLSEKLQSLEMTKKAVSELNECIQRLNDEKRESHQTHHDQLQKIEASKLDLEAKYRASSNQNTQLTQNLFQKDVQIQELQLLIQQTTRENQNLRTHVQNAESQARTLSKKLQPLEMTKKTVSELNECIQRLNDEKRETHQAHHDQLQKIEASKLDLEAKYRASFNQLTQNLFQKDVQIQELQLLIQQTARENQNLRTHVQNLESQARTLSERLQSYLQADSYLL